jgi:hypothetical protein
LDALNKKEAPDLSPYPTETFSTLLPPVVKHSEFFTDTVKNIDEIKKALQHNRIQYRSNDDIQRDERNLLIMLEQTEDPNFLSLDERTQLFNLLIEVFNLLRAAVIAKNSSINKKLLNSTHESRIAAIQSRLKGTLESLPPFPTQSLFAAVPSNTLMKVFWIAMAGLVASLGVVAYRRFYTKT